MPPCGELKRVNCLQVPSPAPWALPTGCSSCRLSFLAAAARLHARLSRTTVWMARMGWDGWKDGEKRSANERANETQESVELGPRDRRPWGPGLFVAAATKCDDPVGAASLRWGRRSWRREIFWAYVLATRAHHMHTYTGSARSLPHPAVRPGRRRALRRRSAGWLAPWKVVFERENNARGLSVGLEAALKVQSEEEQAARRGGKAVQKARWTGETARLAPARASSRLPLRPRSGGATYLHDGSTTTGGLRSGPWQQLIDRPFRRSRGRACRPGV
ncbi:hypothetical protein BDY21DRAFT_337156 [Lineolata rhizophorae]|uniref:Uncharacterized protein n=1 Tax=Lineolata rhizophorae TaxID=578093 RepID=A0A6A6P815_9PEZI|nr:hypothetical protein BDY21DRAFT_337156 [Lineolata rhizophorae]